MKKVYKFSLIVFLVIAGGSLFFTEVDRQFINLTPTEGVTNGIILTSKSAYVQDFTTNRNSISQLGIFLRPTRANLPPSSVNIKIFRENDLLAENNIHTNLITSNSISQIRIDPAQSTKDGEVLKFAVSVPSELDGKIRLQLRESDETFSAETVSFFVNQAKQANPAAFQVYTSYQPPFAFQVGGLFLLTALFVLMPNKKSFRVPLIYSLVIPILFITPALLKNEFPFLITAAAIISIASMIALMNKYHVNSVAAFFSANIFALTSWFPLHLQASGHSYALLSLLPIIYLLAITKPKHYRTIITTIILILLFAFFYNPSIIPAEIVSNPKEVFLDPNQDPQAIKTEPAVPWDNFGSYIGLPALLAAFIGLVSIFWSQVNFKKLTPIMLADEAVVRNSEDCD